MLIVDYCSLPYVSTYGPHYGGARLAVMHARQSREPWLMEWYVVIGHGVEGDRAVRGVRQGKGKSLNFSSVHRSGPTFQTDERGARPYRVGGEVLFCTRPAAPLSHVADFRDSK